MSRTMNIDEKELFKQQITYFKVQAHKMSVIEVFLEQYGSLSRENLQEIRKSCKSFYLSHKNDMPEYERKAAVKILEDEILKNELK